LQKGVETKNSEESEKEGNLSGDSARLKPEEDVMRLRRYPKHDTSVGKKSFSKVQAKSNASVDKKGGPTVHVSGYLAANTNKSSKIFEEKLALAGAGKGRGFLTELKAMAQQKKLLPTNRPNSGVFTKKG